ncbi:Hypothetical predicted protein [Mytilus galloprovincialis]|uniref:Integrase zinc-binding domain-containing protein n=1 Tax=Mytilus galloprovincialis TaxID=29158 RepID=A0A8B6HDZ0_MYTGA|nr:Hypothetical predicted protein [Mytilus galloprovincialis]
MKAKIYVDESAVPKYFKARPLSYALKDKVEMELERLEKKASGPDSDSTCSYGIFVVTTRESKFGLRNRSMCSWEEVNGAKIKKRNIKSKETKASPTNVQDGCIFVGGRVIIPQPEREAMLNELHQEHTGITRMTSLPKSYIWWPGMENGLELTVVNCYSCQENRKITSRSTVTSVGISEPSVVKNQHELCRTIQL